MPSRFFFIIFSVFIFSTLFSGVGQAGQGRLSGRAELRYGAFTAEEGGVRVVDSAHATQQYSVLYETAGKLGSHRIGRYDLALGYEWNWVDAEVDMGESVSIDNPLDKILYRGNLVLDPGGLPFRLNAFSHDMQQTTLETGSVGEINGMESYSVTGLSNGSHVTTGVTFEGGVTGSYYAGQYREVLSSLPRLLIDYRQEDVHDVKGPNPRDYKDSNLAFISINKKKNWFHYRVFKHEDRINPNVNYAERSFLLGTINTRSQREWVNLTNWIRVSTDLSYTEYTEANEVLNSNSYRLNLFTRAERTKWQAASYTSFNRYTSSTDIDKSLTIPLFFHGEFNQSTAWRFQLVGDRFRKDLLAQNGDDYKDGVYFSAQVEAFRRSRYVVRPTLSVEVKNGTRGKGSAGRGQFEFSTNPQYRQAAQLVGEYSVAVFEGTTEKGLEGNAVEQQFEFGLEYTLGSGVIGGFEGRVSYASGEAVTGIFDRINSDAADAADGFGAFGSVFVDSRLSGNLGNRISISYDLLNSSDADSASLSIDHRMDYRRRAISASILTSYTETKQSGKGLYDKAGKHLRSGQDFISSGNVRYDQGRAFTAKIEYDYNRTSFSNDRGEEFITFRQDAAYTGWSRGGLLRKLFSVSEEIGYEVGTAVDLSGKSRLATFTLIGEYYPSRRTLLRSRVLYLSDEVLREDSLAWSLSAAVNYAKLQVELSYAYGVFDREAGLDRNDDIEHAVSA